jgi:hypothetical protein
MFDKLIRLLTSDRDGEVVATVHALIRTLQVNNLDIHALAKRIENGIGFDEGLASAAFNSGYRVGMRKATASRSQGGASGSQGANWWNRLARKCQQQADRLSTKEKALHQPDGRCAYTSEKQANWLQGISNRLGVE